MAEVEQWEYHTEIIRAHIDNPGVREALSRRWPTFKPSKFSPETMVPHLDQWGAEGWELVHMEPVAGTGSNMDIHFTGQAPSYSNEYFCVFKRRKHA